MFSLRLARLLVSLLILAILVFVGCQRAGDAPDAENADVQIALQPLPLEDTLVVILTGADGAPLTDATVALEGNMNHAGMIPVLADAVADDADGAADGRYRLPFTFTMLGDWIITVTVTDADGSSFSRNLEVRAGSDGFSGDEIMPADGSESVIPNAHAEDNHNVAFTSDTFTVDHAGARPAPLTGGTGAVYFDLNNHGDATVTLMGAESPAAAAVELHTTINDNGVLRMRQLVDGIEIPPGGSLELTPGGMHLMLVDLAAPLVEGESLDLTLHFANADDLTVTVPVLNPDDFPADEEAHDHD
jgi:copper(I)-binding protein